MRNSVILFATSVIAIFLLKSCASIQAPTGGPKDETPPEVVSAIPTDNQINYKGQEIVLEFDERIQVENLEDQLLITPLLEKVFTHRVRKNKLFIEFEEPFQPNTTYSINFRDAIRDITENNILSNYSISFSTGTYIDSISISGKITDLHTNVPIPNVNVNLYHANDTFDITNHRPIYLTKTDKDGNYIIKNIKNDVYDLYVLDDKTGTMLYEKETERIAFRKAVDLNNDVTEFDIAITSFINTPPRLINKFSIDGIFNMTFNRGLESLSVTKADDSTFDFYIMPDQAAKNFTLYNNINNTDSIPVIFIATDSLGNSLTDTTNIIFDTKKKNIAKPVIAKIQPENRSYKPTEPFVNIIFNKPIVKINFDSIALYQDSLNIQTIDNQDIKYNQYRTELRINSKISSPDSLILAINESAFINIQGDSSLAELILLKPVNAETVGSISGKVKTEFEHFILQLLDTKFNVLEEVKNTNNFQFNFIPASTYYLRIIHDINGNGRWDTGNLEEQLQPEPIMFHKDKISLRANWEVRDVTVDTEP